jgi:hypothetical protein
LKSLWKQKEVLQLTNGILTRKFFNPHSEIFQIVVPKHCKQEILNLVHSEGHFGVLRTNLGVQSRFYWPFWQSDVARYVRNCVPCNQRKGPRRKQYPPSKQYLCSEPMQRVAIDLVGPLTLTE